MRVLLDTNVWRYVVAADDTAELRRCARRHGWELQVAPAVVYEALRYANDEVRREVVEVLTRAVWTRLMPEIFTESESLVAVIRKRRPEWMRADPDRADYFQSRSDWVGRGGFWGRARKDPAWQATLIARVDDGGLERARIDAKQRRAAFSDIPFEKLDTRWTARVPGRSDGVEVWRVENAGLWWQGLFDRSQDTYRDWCAPFVDLHKLRRDRASWEVLWYDEIDPMEVPGQWLRWAVGWFQGTKSVTGGTPGDNQLASYLADTDVLVSADKPLVAIVDAARRHAPFEFAQAVLIPATGSPTAAILAALAPA